MFSLPHESAQTELAPPARSAFGLKQLQPSMVSAEWKAWSFLSHSDVSLWLAGETSWPTFSRIVFNVSGEKVQTKVMDGRSLNESNLLFPLEDSLVIDQ